jgi:hypothetical protein
LPIAHSHRDRSFAYRGIDVLNSHDRIPKHRQQRIKDEGKDCRVPPDAADQRHRKQKAEQSETGNGLQNAGDRDRNAAERRPARS